MNHDTHDVEFHCHTNTAQRNFIRWRHHNMLEMDYPLYDADLLNALEAVLPALDGCPQETIDEANLAIRRHA